MVKNFKIKIFADGADLSSIKRLNSIKYISGFTTNPTLMKRAGIKDYKKFALNVLKYVKIKPISFEVFADSLNLMKQQGKEIASWGKNIYVKIPVTNSKGVKTTNIIKSLSKEGISLNITALFTKSQILETVNALDKETKSIISIFAGRIADTGVNPENIMKYALKVAKKKNIEVLWASTRETYNIFEAQNIKCHIITVPHNILSKFDLISMNLNKLSLATVKSFLKDSIQAGFKIKV
jgi:transaldolase|tara:strand:+ start:6586 stop:7299 length:714 start_codon:yes stop_codon:yes gene_type:complete